MHSLPLTDSAIRSALASPASGRVDLRHPTEPGLMLRVGKQAVWSVQIRLGDGCRRRLTLGDWPELSGDAAVEAARRRRAIATACQSAEVETVEDLFAQYAMFKAPQLKRHVGTLNSLRDALATILYRDPLTLTRKDIATIVNKKSLTAPSHANRQLAYMKAFFNWGVDQGLASHNPAASVPKPARETPRD